MLLNSKGNVVAVPRKNKQNAASIDVMLVPLREVLTPSQKHDGKFFRIETRAHCAGAALAG